MAFGRIEIAGWWGGEVEIVVIAVCDSVRFRISHGRVYFSTVRRVGDGKVEKSFAPIPPRRVYARFGPRVR